jgi:hypothetical protein
MHLLLLVCQMYVLFFGQFVKHQRMALRRNKVLAVRNYLLNKPCVKLPSVHHECKQTVLYRARCKSCRRYSCRSASRPGPAAPGFFQCFVFNEGAHPYDHNLNVVGGMRHYLLEARFDFLPDIVTNLFKFGIQTTQSLRPFPSAPKLRRRTYRRYCLAWTSE